LSIVSGTDLALTHQQFAMQYLCIDAPPAPVGFDRQKVGCPAQMAAVGLGPCPDFSLAVAAKP
jgi:hypothetical protein